MLPPRPTLLLEPEALRSQLGVEVTLAVETFQYTGSFKYRAASNVAATVPHPHIITASSGNFGQAIAFACKLAGKRCTVVMPETSSQVKIEAVRSHGADVDLVDTRQVQREDRVAEVSADHPDAYVASAYADPLVIAGNASLGIELARSGRLFDAVICPIGGGGLAAGLAQGFASEGYETMLLAAEPSIANDAARTLRQGTIQVNEFEPQTLADGARTRSIGQHNWAVLRGSLSEVIEVSEEQIAAALRSLFLKANLKAEPTGCLTIGALLARPEEFRGRKVCCVVSGGNVEAALYARLLEG